MNADRNVLVGLLALAIGITLHILHPPCAGASETSASSNQPGFIAAGGMDGDRFNPDAAHAWKGSTEAESWWWQCCWDEPREVGAILQVVGDDPMTLPTIRSLPG